MKFKKLFVVILAGIMVLSTSGVSVFAAEATTSPTEATTSPTEAPTGSAEATTVPADPYSGIGCYMAFMQIQTTSWVYRNNFEDAGAGYGTDIFKTVYNNETSAATSTVIKDTVIDGDGDYTISLNDISLEGSTDFNMVAISTNIPLDAGIEVTAAALKYDSRTITSAFVQKNDNKKYVHIMLINQYDSTMKDTVNTLVPPDGSDMIITFTVAGFGYEKTVAEPTTAPVEVTAAPAADETAAADVTSDAVTTSDETAASENGNNSSLSTGAIIGIIVGAGIALVIIAIIVVSIKKKKKS